MAKFGALRVVVAALALTTLSFAAGVAGDLTEPQNSGVRVVLRIPPELPADTPRAAPLPPLAMTQIAYAAELPRPTARRITPPPISVREVFAAHEADFVVEARVKPQRINALVADKPDPDRAPKAALQHSSGRKGN